MDFNTDIPKDVYLPLLPIFAATHRISSPDPKKYGLYRFIKRDHLRSWMGSRKDEIIQSLEWALNHPEKDYTVFIHERNLPRYSNAECLKLLSIFLLGLQHLDDAGPDIFDPEGVYLAKPGDMDDYDVTTEKWKRPQE
jgi:hypothetical protein